MADDRKTVRFQMLLDPPLAERLDAWCQKQHPPLSRAEALRKFASAALAEEEDGTTDPIAELRRVVGMLPFTVETALAAAKSEPEPEKEE